MYVDKRQIAEMFGVSVSTVNNYMRQGMPFYKIGGKLVRFVYEEVEDWIKERHDDVCERNKGFCPRD